MNRNDVESTGIDRFLAVKENGDRVIEVFPPRPPRCEECGDDLTEPYLAVAKSDRYALGATIHWHCYNTERI